MSTSTSAPNEIGLLTALSAVENGADIYSYALAWRLREIEKEEPELIEICRPMEDPPGDQQQPYFGCICKEEGRNRLRQLKRKTAS